MAHVVVSNSRAQSVDDMEMLCAQPHSGAKAMSQAKLIDNITYFRGRNIKDMSTDQLICSLKELEAEIKDLNDIQTESSAVTKQIDKLKAALTVVVTELDGRA